MTLRQGQLMTYMTGDVSSLPKEIQVYTSNLKDVGLQYDKPWETIVIDPIARQSVPEFEDMGYFLHTDDIRQRTTHHYYVVDELQKLGYRIVSHRDDFTERREKEEYEASMEGLNALLKGLNAIRAELEEQHNLKVWNKRLEGIPGLDFTPDEWRKIESLKYLRDKGKI